tara:strand:- start:1306 stop:1461 length:156 start_codon:yes stop_codon:yes gene_type:complete
MGGLLRAEKVKRRYLNRISFRLISGERSVVLLDIDFDADNQSDLFFCSSIH